MIVINTVDTQRFSLNGIEYFKNFTPVVAGDSVRILNTYTSYIELVHPSNYANFTVNGNTFANVADLQSALLPVIYTRESLGNSQESQTVITTATDITTNTVGSNGLGQKGVNTIINNGANNINVTIDTIDGFLSSYLKEGSGDITFVQGAGRTLIQVDGTDTINGAIGSTAVISSVGTNDYLRISNA